jgi:dipeptidyl-peptidase-4
MRSIRLLMLILLTPAAWAGPVRRVEIEDITADPPFAGRGISEVVWVPGASERFSFLESDTGQAGARRDLYIEDARTGARQKVVSAAELVPPDAGKDASPVPLEGHVWSPDGRALLLSGANDLWLFRLDSRKLERLTRGEDEEEFASFSPDGRTIAFVRKHDLFAIDLATRAETRLTTDGADHVFNGRLDWVYEEELASRSGKCYEFSPDGRSIAYLRLDEARVPEYPLVDFMGMPHAALRPLRYPNPGDPNSSPSVHVVSLAGRETGHVDFGKDDDLYVVPHFVWAPDSKSVAYQVLDRSQTHLSLFRLDIGGGAQRRLLEETDPFWINVSNFAAGPPTVETPYFLADGRFLWLSERSGYAHLYLGSSDGHELRAVTRGEWMVDRLLAVDEKHGLAYFTSTISDARERQVCRVRLVGGEVTRLTREGGVHDAEVSPNGGLLLEKFSKLGVPQVRRLLTTEGRLLRTVEQPSNRLGELALASPELVDLKASDGTLLHGLIVKPPDFDPSKRYPVLVRVYGGPAVQTVTNAFGAVQMLDHYLAGRGIVVFKLDNRGSFGRGHAFESPIFKEMGKHELADQLAGVAYLKSLSYVDPGRIGIYGWSYGGYMTLYALTHAPDVFKCGVAGAPPVDYRLYDTIYSERYLRTPRENLEGYKASAPLTSASKLKARLLLVHGASDDNVHLQNSLQFIDALISAGIPYELQIQPRARHGVAGKAGLDHLNRAIATFLEKNLSP